MTRTYAAVLEVDAEVDCGIWFYDLPGCVSAGEDPDAAIAAGREAMILHLEGMLMDGETPPEPTDIDIVDGLTGGVVVGLTVDL